MSPRYIGPSKILKRIGSVAYELDLPNDLAKVHPVFHVSMLRKFIGDIDTIVPLEKVTIEENLTYEEVPIEILDRQVKRVRNKDIAPVKVLWLNQKVESATWEAEEDMEALSLSFLLYSSLKVSKIS